MILAVTGHRKIGGSYGSNPLSRAVVARMAAELDRLQPTRVICGMALGVDQWLAWLAVKRGIPVTAAVPFVGHHLVWTWDQQSKYHALAAQASTTEIVSELDDKQLKDKRLVAEAMYARNRWMVDHCDMLLAVWDGSDGGTSNCVKYAQRVGREIVRIDPKEIAT